MAFGFGFPAAYCIQTEPLKAPWADHVGVTADDLRLGQNLPPCSAQSSSKTNESSGEIQSLYSNTIISKLCFLCRSTISEQTAVHWFLCLE